MEQAGNYEAQRSAQAPTAIDYAGMNAPDLLQACGDDGMIWATAFCQIKKARGWTLDEIDEGLMVVWFANAIEASWGKRVKRAEPQTRPSI